MAKHEAVNGGLSKRADRCHDVEATRQSHAGGKTRSRGGGTERGRNYGPRQRAPTCLAKRAWKGTGQLHHYDGVTLDGV